MAADMDKFVADIDVARATAAEAMAVHTSCKDDLREKCENEARTLQNKMDALDMVRNSECDKLAKMISRFQSQQSERLAASPSSASAVGRALLGFAPPCASYCELLPVSKLRSRTQDVDTCASNEDIAEIRKDIASMKKPIRELMGAVRSAARELATARDQEMKMSKGGGKGGRGKGKKGTGGRGAVLPMAPAAGAILFATCPEKVGLEMACLAADAVAEAAKGADFWSTPCIIKRNDKVQGLLDNAQVKVPIVCACCGLA